MLGVVELLSGTELSDDQLKLMSMMRGSGEMLQKLINDILDFSKIAAGRLVLEEIDFDIRSATVLISKTGTYHISSDVGASSIVVIKCRSSERN